MAQISLLGFHFWLIIADLSCSISSETYAELQNLQLLTHLLLRNVTLKTSLKVTFITSMICWSTRAVVLQISKILINFFKRHGSWHRLQAIGTNSRYNSTATLPHCHPSGLCPMLAVTTASGVLRASCCDLIYFLSNTSSTSFTGFRELTWDH